MEPELPLPRPPLEHQPLFRVLPRIVYQLVILDYRTDPSRYDNPQIGIMHLADRLRLAGFGALFKYFYRASLAISLGAKLHEWRDHKPHWDWASERHHARLPFGRRK